MTLTVTERDKKLLCLVSCALVILVFVRFLILPGLEKQQDLEMELDELTLQQTQWELDMRVLTYIDQLIRDNEARKLQVSAPYYGYLETRQMDRVLTNLALSHGLFPRSMYLTPAREGCVPDYLYFQPPTGRDTVPHGYVHLGTAELEAEGSMEQWIDFMDHVLKEFPGLRVTSFGLDEITYLNSQRQSVTTNVVEARVELYMCYTAGEEGAP